MRKPSKKIWFLFLVLFLLASIFPPWECSFLRVHSLQEIKFSLFFNPPVFFDYSTSYTVNSVIYGTGYTGDIAWRILFLEYFVLVICCISLSMIEGIFQKICSRLVLTKTQKLITVIVIIAIAIVIAAVAVEKFYLLPQRDVKLYDKLEKAGYFENTTPQQRTDPNDLLSQLISHSLSGYSTSLGIEAWKKLSRARDNGYSAEQILAAFCKVYPTHVGFCPEYKNVTTSLTLDEMASRKKISLLLKEAVLEHRSSTKDEPNVETDPNKSGIHFIPHEYDPNK